MAGELDVGAGAATGAASGAAAGAALGPVGAGVGAVVGGILGGLGGLFKSKAKKYAKKAAAVDRRMAGREAAVQRRQLVRGIYIARARAAAAAAAQEGTLGSAAMGAISSIESQAKFNLGFFDTQVEGMGERNKYAAKAGKFANKAAGVAGIANILGSAASLAGSFSSSSSPTGGAFNDLMVSQPGLGNLDITAPILSMDVPSITGN